MKVEWDERKRKINLRKHGIDFVGCEAIFAGTTKTMIDDRENYREERFVTFGLLDDRVVAVVHIETADTIRVISIRKATRHEQTLFFEGIQD
ncbi:MAG: BrnT family toxin [Betaproteobacteria bacterium]